MLSEYILHIYFLLMVINLNGTNMCTELSSGMVIL